MLKLVKTVFRNYLEVLLWINLAVCALGGAYIGRTFGQIALQLATSFEGDVMELLKKLYISPQGGGTGLFIGFFVGAAIGLFTNVIIGGFIATIADMHKNIDQLKLIEHMKMKKGSGAESAKRQVPMSDANIFDNADDVIFMEQDEEVYTATTRTLIKARPETSAATKKVIEIGDAMYFQKLGSGGKWFYGKSVDGTAGWCFIVHFKRG